MTTSVIFAMAFFGAGLLYPQYFIGIARRDHTGRRPAARPHRGIGAMLTMPIGILTDKIGPGKIVLPGF